MAIIFVSESDPGNKTPILTPVKMLGSGGNKSSNYYHDTNIISQQ